MSYSEENGQVVLRMSKEDYESIVFALGLLTYDGVKAGRPVEHYFALTNRINEGHRGYTPYQVPEKKP